MHHGHGQNRGKQKERKLSKKRKFYENRGQFTNLAEIGEMQYA